MSRRTKSLATLAAATLMTSLLQPAGAATTWTGRDPAELRESFAARSLLKLSTAREAPVVGPVTENFEVVSHVPIGGPTPNADVFLYKHRGKKGKHAYIGRWGFPCTGQGLKIVRTKWPRYPKIVARAGARRGTSAEDMVVFRKGRRDILAVGIQPCEAGAVGGLALYNVTTPSEPRFLGFQRVDPFGVHELDVAVRPDGRILALAAANFAEVDALFGNPPTGGDFRIIEITRPRHPRVVADWGVIADSDLASFRTGAPLDTALDGLGYFAAQFVHSARSADNGMTAYVSYWDSGVLKFDISDPSNPVLLGRTSYPPTADGDAHSVTSHDVNGERYLYQNDEDFSPWSILSITTTSTANTVYQGLDTFWLPTTFTGSEPVNGELFDAGEGCAATAFEGAAGKVVLVDVIEPGFSDEEPPCDPFEQMTLAAAAGAEALIINWVSPLDPFVFPPPDPELVDAIIAAAPELRVAAVPADDGMAEAIRTAPGNSPTTITVTPEPPSWGFLRIYRESGATDTNADGVPEYEQVGEFSDLPNVVGPDALMPGEWSIHNTEIRGNRAYSSWYSHGIVALDLSDPKAPVKVGQFRRPSVRKEMAFGPEAYPATWGVVIDPDSGLIYASDMRSGLWIIRPTGPAASQ